MADTFTDRLMDALRQVDALYFRLVLLVGPSGVGKTGVLRNLAEEHHTSVINVNLVLARGLLELSPKQRLLRLPELFAQIAKDASHPLLLDNLEILFDKDLKQDPLRLLQGLSRNQAVVAAWSGIFREGRLTYGEPTHPEYRSYGSPDALVVPMNSTVEDDWDSSQQE
ncbi:MAG: BREX-3 system P-loop-containing protein BrxF [Verrucomicrobiota bacterium]|nr:BREX-3 system P-loop-containing protein BrxF [Verrucomicrobiota bacterium]HCF94152.1 BREX-3 system P-loop-containing protein BrxF [Verrucomicrobiota bacterium]